MVVVEGVNSVDGRAGQCTQKNSGLRSTIEVHSQFLLNSMKDKEIDKKGLIPPNIRYGLIIIIIIGPWLVHRIRQIGRVLGG